MDAVRGDISPEAWKMLSKIWIDDGCWGWDGKKTWDGYGSITVVEPEKQRSVYAHRFMYELMVGKIPDGMDIDHLCRNRGCCNPDHLQVVTRVENLRRNRGTLVCKAGHTIAGDNRKVMGIYHGRERARCRKCFDAWLVATKEKRYAQRRDRYAKKRNDL